MKTPFALAPLVIVTGCVYPPQQSPTPPVRTTVTLDLPYDLAWDAVQNVAKQNAFHVVVANPNEGILEAQSVGGFSLQDADCGQLSGIAGKVNEEPDPDSSAVYDFHVIAAESEQSTVSVTATFTAPLHVPLRPMSSVQCVSRGREEARLLNQIKVEAGKAHRPEPVHGNILKNG